MKFTELYQKLLKINLTKVFPLVSMDQNKAQYMIRKLHSAMWNLSDKSSDVCQRIMQVKLDSDILGYLNSDTFKPSTLNDVKSSFARGMIGILHNVVQRFPGARETFRECGAVGILQTFRECDSMRLSTLALMTQAYLVTEDENEKLNSNIETFNFLVEKLHCSINSRTHNGLRCAVIEVIEVINKLASNDSNKQRIVESGALPCYVTCMEEKFGVKVQHEAAHGLWTLAFKCRAEIVKEPGCIDGLKVLLNHEDEKVKQKAQGALWILEEKDKDATTVVNSSEATIMSEKSKNGHVFISYQWDAKPTVLKVRDKLKEAGFNVWIDEDDMSGSVLDAMANAVEQATVVVVCLSQKYKDSPSCRTEAEYTFRLRKKVIPLRLQSKYYPDGWLGIMIGSKLVLDVSVETKVEESTKRLIKELSGQDEPDGRIKASVAPINQANFPSEGLSTTSPVHSWTEDDVKGWMKKNNIKHLDQL